MTWKSAWELATRDSMFHLKKLVQPLIEVRRELAPRNLIDLGAKNQARQDRAGYIDALYRQR
jgi:hypothetical protein